MDALTRGVPVPIIGRGLGEILAQCRESLPATGKHFAEEVFHETEVGCGDGEHRDDVAQTNREREVGDLAKLEKLGGEARIRPEQQTRLPLDDPSIEVRDRHRRSPHRCAAVNLGAVLGNDCGIVASVELTRDGEARVPADFGDA